MIEKVKTSKLGASSPTEKWGEVLKRMTPNVMRLYEREVNAFTEWLGLNLEELYQLGVEAQKSDDPSERMIVTDKLVEYLTHIKENKRSERGGKKYSYGKLKDVKTAVAKFYSINGISIIKTERGSELAKLIKRRETDFKKPTKEEIRRLIGACPLRLKAAVALQKDSGLRVSDLAQVRYKHIKEGVNSKDGFGGFLLRTEKTDKVALPLFGPEATYYLRLWIENWEREEGRRIEDENYIFPVVRNCGITKRGTKINASTLSEIINQQIEKIGLKGQISDNGLRYFHQSQLESRMNKNIILKIQGKTIGDSSSHYSKHDIDELLPLYKEAYPVLMIEPGETVSSEMIEELKEKNKSLEERLEKFERLGEFWLKSTSGELGEAERQKYHHEFDEWENENGKEVVSEDIISIKDIKEFRKFQEWRKTHPS